MRMSNLYQSFEIRDKNVRGKKGDTEKRERQGGRKVRG